MFSVKTPKAMTEARFASSQFAWKCLMLCSDGAWWLRKKTFLERITSLNIDVKVDRLEETNGG